MDDWKKYARARDQIYSLKVAWREVCVDKLPKKQTAELETLVEMVTNLLDASASAFETGRILVMQLDLYEAIPLPGFEDLDIELKSPPDWGD